MQVPVSTLPSEFSTPGRSSKQPFPSEWGWTAAQKSDPYAIACFVFAIAMIPAGRLQDRIGPRWVATIGGVAVALGCIIAGLAGSSYIGFVVGFGLFGGIGIGFGYAAATPAAVKWFPASQTGMIAGLVVAGFGLASVYIAPTAQALLGAYGVSSTMIIFGVAFLRDRSDPGTVSAKPACRLHTI